MDVLLALGHPFVKLLKKERFQKQRLFGNNKMKLNKDALSKVVSEKRSASKTTICLKELELLVKNTTL